MNILFIGGTYDKILRSLEEFPVKNYQAHIFINNKSRDRHSFSKDIPKNECRYYLDLGPKSDQIKIFASK